MSRRKHIPKDATKYSNDKMLNRYYPKTDNQKEYIRQICENQIVVATGPSGCGKTSLAICLACEHLLEDKIQKIILTKPYVQCGSGLGFLPGNVQDKTEPYLHVFHDYLDYFLGVEQKTKLMNEGKIEIIQMEFCRGVTFRSSYIIIDECQNCSLEMLVLMLTRLDDYSKLICNGDLKQNDLGKAKSGLNTICEKLDGVEGVGLARLEKCDILRSGIVRRVLERLE